MKSYEVKYRTVPSGETIAYRECGEGREPVLVLLHGNQSSGVFFQIAMEALGDTAHVIAPDMIGFGDSTYNHPVDTLRGFSVGIAELLTALGVRGAIVLGWSTGGGVVLELAADHPELVARAILLDSVGTQGYPMYRLDAQFKPILSERIWKREDIAADPVQVAPVQKAFNEGNRAFMKWVWDLTIFSQYRPEPEEYDAYLDGIMKERCLLDVDYALINFNITDEFNGVREGDGRLALVKCPVTVIHGAKDLVVPVAEGIATAKRLGGKADLIVLAGATHALMYERAPVFLRLLRGYCEEARG